MRCYSTNDHTHLVPLRDAVMNGMPPDGGLYMPASLPTLPGSFFRDLRGLPLTEVSIRVARALVGDALPEDVLARITAEAVGFGAPVVDIEDGVKVVELFHGPTLAFKDFGARFMAGLMGYFVRENDRELTIVVATSGDTGGAIARAFAGAAGIRVVVLFPRDRVSDWQERQFTTIGGNIIAVEVAGSFDDCQRLAKTTLGDDDVRALCDVTSANSINIGRLLPQTFYYFHARASETGAATVMSVPCGNFGNLCAGLMARRMGLDVERFVAATNANDSVPRYLESGEFIPRASVHTISNAMDVGNPSNLARIRHLYHDDVDGLRRDLAGYSFSDNETRAAIQDVFERTGYVLDPHSAVGYAGLRAYRKASREPVAGFFLATAHPAKFRNVVEEITGRPVDVPERLSRLGGKDKTKTAIPNDYDHLKSLLID